MYKLKQNKMKNLFIGLAFLMLLSSCGSNQGYNQGYSNGGQVVVNQPNVSVTPTASNLGDNLNLQALGELVKSSNNAQDIEQKLNQDQSINNLDLDGDGKVDYIKVTEYGDGNARGFSFTVEQANGEKQEIATVDIQKNNNTATLNIQGNQQIYGQGAYYQSNYNFTDLMIMSYLFSYHRPYYSPYRYGYYPSYYHSYGCSPYSSYRSRMSTSTRTSTITRTTTTTSKVKSPNANLNSKSVNARAQTLANPTRSQKAFTPTKPSNSRPSTGGFSNKGSSPSHASSSPSRSAPRSSSFGSSSHSSSPRSSGGGRRR